jgi:hypothetical protein
MTTTATAELCELRDFLAPRLSLETVPPFWRDGQLIITDGRMMVVFDCDEPEESFHCNRFIDGKWSLETPRNPPGISAILDSIGKELKIKLPNTEGPPSRANEQWVTTRPCSRCDGTGKAECNMGHIHKCDSCLGSLVEEYRCEEAVELVAIGIRMFASRYVWLLNQLPALRIHSSTTPDMLACRFQFGTAFLMAVRRS